MIIILCVICQSLHISVSFMANTTNFRSWKILCWNVRGLNSDKKWDSIRDKKEDLDLQFIRNFCPPIFDAFEFLPSHGASDGLVTIWKSYMFHVLLLLAMITAFRLNSPQITMARIGSLPMSMGLVHQWANKHSLPG